MNETLKTIYNLHTTHANFSSHPVDQENIKIILDACVRAANASNRQSYSIVVIDGEDNVQKIIGCGVKSPIALLFCADFNRIYDIGEYLDYPSDYDNLFSFLTAHTDAVIAAQTAVIAATSLGLASMYTNSIHNANRKDLAEMYEELNLPDKHIFPVAAVLLGYEDKAPDYKAGRLNDAGVVHYGTYKKLTTEQCEEIIKTINDPENHFGATGGCNTYLENYYTKWAAPQTSDNVKKMDDMLYEKLISFIKN